MSIFKITIIYPNFYLKIWGSEPVNRQNHPSNCWIKLYYGYHGLVI